MLKGLEVRQIAEQRQLLEVVVRQVLRELGVAIGPRDQRDPVSVAATKIGFVSFGDFARARQGATQSAQATELGVSRGRLTRTYRAYSAVSNTRG